MRGQWAGKIDNDSGTRGPGGRARHARPKRPCPAEVALAATARQAVRAAVRAGAVEYRRASILPRLVAVAPAEVADDSPAGTRRILALLARALRSERRRGRAGHWSYDLNRHIGLRQAMLAEMARLRASRSRPPRSTGSGNEARWRPRSNGSGNEPR